MHTKPTTKAPLALAIAALLHAATAGAANYGTDLNLTMMPAAGGMGGVGVASPQDVGSAVFGNPATLSDFTGTQFMFGATFYSVDVTDTHDGSVTGTAWRDDSQAGPYLVPNIAVSQSLSDSTVLGLGLSVVGGIGSDFRGAPGSLNPLAEVLLFGANAGVGYQVSDNFSVGAAATIAMGLAQVGLSTNTASTSGFGIRGTLGATYTLGATRIGGYYRSPLSVDFDNLVQYSASGFHDATIEQPQEVAIGISNQSLLDGRLLLEADVIWKNWESAETYEDIYDDQTIFAVGAQLRQGPWRWRVGYTHAPSPIKSNVGSRIGNIDSLLVGGVTVPMSSALVQYVQATGAEVVWEDQISLGLGWDINAHMSLDTHVAFALDRSENIGGTEVDASAWQLGAALTWRF